MKKIKYLGLMLVFFLTISFNNINVSAATGPAAKIGNKEYLTFKEAHEAAKAKEEIILLQDLTDLSNTTVITKEITLNLNNHKVTNIVNTSTNVVTIKNGTIYGSPVLQGILNKNKLVLDNVKLSISTNTGDMGASAYMNINTIVNNGTLTIKNSSIDVQNIGYSNYPITYITNEKDGSITIESGNYNLGEVGLFIMNNGSFIINGGTYKDGAYNYKIENYKNFTINNGIVERFIINNHKNGTFNIKNGTFVSTAIHNGEDYSGYLYNTGKEKAIVNISGGNFNNEETILSNLQNSAYSTINISGGKFTSKGTIVANYGLDSNSIVITGGEFTSRDSAGIHMKNGSLVIGTNDNQVSKDAPILNIGSIYAYNVSSFSFYDGKMTLVEKINKDDNYKTINLPTGYNIKYDDNGDKTYTAYLYKEVKEDTTKEEDKKEEANNQNTVNKDTTKEDNTTKNEEQKENVETTVENPATGFSGFTIIVAVLAVLMSAVYVFVRKKTYFSRM